MEIEVRNRVAQHIAPTGELLFAAPQLHDNLAILHGVHALGVHLLQDLDCLGETGLQLGKGGLVVLHGDGLDLCDAHGAALGCVTEALDLKGQRAHVAYEARLDKRGFTGGCMGQGLLEDGREAFEAVNEARDGYFVEGERHFEELLGGLLIWNIE